MKKIKSRNFLWIYFLIGLLVGWTGIYFGLYLSGRGLSPSINYSDDFETDLGNWLAAQHAVFVDDFSSAIEFMDKIRNDKSEIVASSRNLVLFLDSGDLRGAEVLKKSNSAAWRVINAASSAKKGKWGDVYAEFKNERTQIMAPFRIWSGVASGNFKKTLDFINSFPANNSWKNFMRAMIYAATKNPKTARKYFGKVPAGFMNLLDYHIVMSFYKKHGFEKDWKELKEKWVDSPGGMYMSDLDLGENWSYYDSEQKMLAASLIQNVSHNGEAGFTDTGLLVLRVAAALGGMPDAVNYYTGGYFYASGSDNYKKYWNKLKDNPIYAPFIEMKNAERIGDDDKTERELDSILRKNPLFMPAIQKLWRRNMQNGQKNNVLRILGIALRRPNVPAGGRAYLLKLRGHTFYIFERYEEAERDLKFAAKLSPMEAGVMGLQARIWAAQKKNLNEAYRYAISLVKAFPANVENWDVLAMVVLAKEGDDAALEILDKVARVAEECSELFLHLGDLRLKAGLRLGAAQAYRKAVALSDDGLVIKSDVERKLRRLK
jgi:tetratricopeptide (TPR) repeat protein